MGMNQDFDWTCRLSWAAGLFEGEGCIRPENVTGVRLTLGMTDEDVVRSFAAVVGAGTVRRQEMPGVRKPMFVWTLQDRREVRRVLESFVPLLHSRRRARAEEMLVRLESNRGRKEEWTHCPRGHSLSGANLRTTNEGRRRCRACERERSRRYASEARIAA